MGLFNIFKSKEPVKGQIGYYGLEEWWLTAFTDTERDYIKEKFKPLGLSGDSLTSGEIGRTNQTAIHFLQALAGWFAKVSERVIARKIIDKAESLKPDESNILDQHFLFSEKIKIYYKDRVNPEFLNKAISACHQQIEIAPLAANKFKSKYGGSQLPSHNGFEQLAIILEKQKNYQEVIDLCTQANKQGWAGNWEARIERCGKKIIKA